VITGFDPPQVEKTAKSVVLWMEKSKPFSATARALSGVLVVGEERYAVNAPLGEGPPASTESPGILFAVALAFLGGVILNLMPCVFPVLGIKVMALVAQGNGDRWHSRKHGKVYVLGVLVSFWLLTALLLLLRRAGESVGWGFQLQHPAFVIAMIFLFSLLSANLAGFVEFGGRLMGVGSGLASREGYSGSFFSGVLAVVVATPCTAPFMGTAISVVLGEPAWAVFSVFTALALGLGLPFLFLSYQPSLLRRMPRPGAWMERLKEFFAFPLAATVIWLFWVLALQVGSDGLLLVALSLLSLFGAIWAWKRFRGAIGKGAGWALLLGAALLAWAGSSRRPLPAAQAAGLWQPFSPEKVEAERAKGKAIFIDFTAAWCLTCQVNKALVLDRPGMQEFFRSRGIALFLADWTNSDPRITKALEGYGRIGVPVYVAYPAGSDRAKVLPQLLTEELVKHAFP
jgi:thiol:disulfide interchange protein DsbD